MNIGILGGGISGLTLQRFLKHDSEVLEKAAVPGGLCRTFWKDGFAFDIGGHILFSKHQHVTDFVNEVLGDNVNYCKRANKILFKGRYVKYPFENDLGALDKQDAYECLIDYLKNDHPKPTNLEEWGYYTFGKSIADKYFLAYNRKIWKTEPRDMSLEWVGRIPRPPMEDVVKSALGIETEGYTHQLYFRYPLHGGFEALVKAIIKDHSKVACNTRVQSIRKEGGAWAVSDGQKTRRYDRLVMAFPVAEAIKCFEGVPAEVVEAVRGLRYNALRVAFIAVNNESLMDKSAVYIPDPTVHPHRVCYMGFFSPNTVRPGTSSLVAETTVRPGDAVDRLSNDEFLDLVIGDLDRVGILRKQDVIVRDTRRVEYAYPVYDHNYTKNVGVLRDWFGSLGIDQLGRFAEFDYINSDECIHRAMRLADKLNARPARALAS
ncbi:MAG TPA: FAD-dependent oxidoreductase [Gemmataceae bacterium]|nr:FAD-dependent oxidoreductase [Gemmataceae bacterium]